MALYQCRICQPVNRYKYILQCGYVLLFLSKWKLGKLHTPQISVFLTGYRFAERELCRCVGITVLSPVSSRWLPGRHLVGRWEQPRNAGSLSSVSSWYAPYHHKLPHSRENGTDAVGLPVPSGDPGHVKPLWPGQTRQEAAGPPHDLWHSLWVLLGWHHNHLVSTTVSISYHLLHYVIGGGKPGSTHYSTTNQFTKRSVFLGTSCQHWQTPSNIGK